MAKFKPGDKVVITEPAEDFISTKGQTGTIACESPDEKGFYAVEFDNADFEEADQVLNNCNGIFPDDRGFFVHEDILELVK